MLPDTVYFVTIEEGGRKTSYSIKGEDIDDWVETVAVQMYTKNKSAQFYNHGLTNSHPLYGVAFYHDRSCGCTKTLTGKLVITITEGKHRD